MRGSAFALAAALAAPPLPAAAGTASILVDGAGVVIEATDADRPWYPASLAKLMTLYLVFEAVVADAVRLTDELSVSSHAAAQPASDLGLDPGDSIAVEDAIRAAAIRSANDAAVALAERVAGNESRFADLMNRKARALGMTHTTFRNASGLPHPEQTTTARDLAILALALIRDFPGLYHYFAERSFKFGRRTLATTNGLLDAYDGADGMKTGFTCDSGFNLVASAARDGRRLVAVLLGALSSAERTAAVAKLLNAGFARPAPAGPLLADVAAAAPGPAPRRISAAECAQVAGAQAPAGRLPGWGLVFGAFPERAQAQAAIERARDELRPVLRAGRPAAVLRPREGTRLYSALLVGLRREDAVKACKHLWSLDEYCLALSPEVLNNPQSMWR